MLQVNRSGKRKMVTWLNMLRKCNLYLADPILEPSKGSDHGTCPSLSHSITEP